MTLEVILKKIKLKKVIYPIITLGILLIVAIVFAYSAKFLSHSINKALFLDSALAESLLIKLDLGKFNLIANKLSIEINLVVPEKPQVEEAAIPLEESKKDDIESAQLDKTAVKIAILNSTKTKGLAADLENFLITAGFLIEHTGNTSPLEASTVIKIKESKNNYKTLIREAVSQKYQLAEDQILQESEENDIIIIIGSPR
ncbi:MAG: LytR C-terminal domain-containing protein [Patescibacteria group bacterium]